MEVARERPRESAKGSDVPQEGRESLKTDCSTWGQPGGARTTRASNTAVRPPARSTGMGAAEGVKSGTRGCVSSGL